MSHYPGHPTRHSKNFSCTSCSFGTSLVFRETGTDKCLNPIEIQQKKMTALTNELLGVASNRVCRKVMSDVTIRFRKVYPSLKGQFLPHGRIAYYRWNFFINIPPRINRISKLLIQSPNIWLPRNAMKAKPLNFAKNPKR